jgi:hypothetical protein
MKRLANVLTFLIFVALVTIALFGILVDGQERTPLASDAQRALAPMAVSVDGRTVTFRETAIDGLTIRIEPAAGKFGRTVTFTVGDVRSGRWGLK